MPAKFTEKHMRVDITALINIGFVEEVHCSDELDSHGEPTGRKSHRTFYVYRSRKMPNIEIRFEPNVYDKDYAWYLVVRLGESRTEHPLRMTNDASGFQQGSCPMIDLKFFLKVMNDEIAQSGSNS